MPETDEIRKVKQQHEAEILTKPNVVGVGVGYRVVGGRETDELSVVALVRRKLPRASLSPHMLVPQQVDSIPVDVRQVGHLRAQQSHQDRWRPAPGGVSIGHYQITAGTLGCVVRDRQTGARLILSNNHVLANSNNAQLGDAILQPGPYDGGTQDQDVIARLERFVPIQYTTTPGTCSTAQAVADILNWLAGLMGSSHRLDVFRYQPQAVNQVDSAVARPLDDSQVLDEILEIGTPSGTTPAVLGMGVRKSGRTTGLTSDTVNVIDATVNVTYGAGQIATFEHQIVAGPMSQGGDSGSLVLASGSLQAVGLLFAGSDQSTIFSPINAVLDALQVDLPATAASAARTPANAVGAPARVQSFVRSEQNAEQARQTATARAEAVREAHAQELLSKPNVVGVGVGVPQRGGIPSDEVGLVVMVEKKLPPDELRAQDRIPSEIDGVPVDVQEVGRLRAL